MTTKTKAVEDEADFAERVAKMRTECEAFLDRKAEEAKALYPTLPLSWHRQNLMARSVYLPCACSAVIAAVEGPK